MEAAINVVPIDETISGTYRSNPENSPALTGKIKAIFYNPANDRADEILKQAYYNLIEADPSIEGKLPSFYPSLGLRGKVVETYARTVADLQKRFDEEGFQEHEKGNGIAGHFLRLLREYNLGEEDIGFYETMNDHISSLLRTRNQLESRLDFAERDLDEFLGETVSEIYDNFHTPEGRELRRQSSLVENELEETQKKIDSMMTVIGGFVSLYSTVYKTLLNIQKAVMETFGSCVNDNGGREKILDLIEALYYPLEERQIPYSTKAEYLTWFSSVKQKLTESQVNDLARLVDAYERDGKDLPSAAHRASRKFKPLRIIERNARNQNGNKGGKRC
ncbi:hypothetical protein COV19_07025 [Candidatus Woesearchaeota archaeon CG10_big_fil_rev_8_21_14_0_10_44_13]|nr:MAG: hypothetical protein COV19_07025 [Candidatus Woesearchaeota archaeon CG10_big_fil_rev_8_21_14_0_10_44_13]